MSPPAAPPTPSPHPQQPPNAPAAPAHHHPTAQISLATPTPACPLSLLPMTPHNSYITTTPVLLLSPRPDARSLPKQDYYLTTPDSWPHKTVLSVWTPDRGVFLAGGWPRVITLRGVAVNRLYEEDAVRGVLRRVKAGEGRGQLNIYRGHPGGWWVEGEGEEVGRLVEWWEGVVRGEREREVVEERERRRKERERGEEMERVRREGEEEASRRRREGRDVWEAERERLRKATAEMKAQGRTWGPEGKWWRIDGLY